MRQDFRQLFRTVAACYAVAMVRGSPNPRYLGLPARLRKARKEVGMKRKPLAQKVGRDTKVAADIEAGQRLPTLATVARLASALGVAAAWLAYGLGDMHTGDAPALTDGMGARLEAARSEREVSKAELARLTELSPRAIAKIESGGQAGIETIEALAKALDISPAWLAFNQGPRELPKRRRARSSEPAHP